MRIECLSSHPGRNFEGLPEVCGIRFAPMQCSCSAKLTIEDCRFPCSSTAFIGSRSLKFDIGPVLEKLIIEMAIDMQIADQTGKVLICWQGSNVHHWCFYWQLKSHLPVYWLGGQVCARNFVCSHRVIGRADSPTTHLRAWKMRLCGVEIRFLFIEHKCNRLQN